MRKAITFFLALAGAVATAHSQTAAPAAPAAPSAKPAAGDATRGAGLVSMCVGCHGIVGYQASFPQIYKVPMISGQGAKYIVNALTAYKKGDRKHPTMRGIATTLTEQDMADLGAYYEKHGADSVKTVSDAALTVPSEEVAKLLTKGACVSCHGANYSKPIDPSYPKLAGQHADYLYVSLSAYGTKGNPQMGRNNAIMGAQMAQFNREELKLMAKYIGSLPSELRVVPQSKFR
jgi:cytochrome c553